MPSEYLPTGLELIGSSPTRRIVSAICFRLILRFKDARISRFFNPESCGRKPGVSMISPMSSGKSTSFPICLPFTSTLPLVGCKNPQMHLNMTVFPEPLLPTTPWIFPASKLRLIPFSTVSCPNTFTRSCTSIAFAMA